MIRQQLLQLGRQARKAASSLATMPSESKNKALTAMAQALIDAKEELLAINQTEISDARKLRLNEAFIDRLQLNDERIEAMANGLTAISELADPVGRVLAEWDVPSGLHIKRVAQPLGVIGVIYESRPNVTADAAALCLKSGNAVILRGGSECAATNKAILCCLQRGLTQVDFPQHVIQYLPTQDREAVGEMLKMNDTIDVIIPRGGRSLVKRVTEESRIPLFQHLEGICHTYIHAQANKQMAIEVIGNAKLRRPGICGATETLLIDEAIAEDFLPDIIDILIEEGCELRGCAKTQNIDPRVNAAHAKDWSTEYLDKILSIKVVSGIEQAIEHIREYSSSHTEAIITDDNAVAQYFMKVVDSSIVMHNASTQFADGGEFGMGAEIGISTGKLHARGPVGVEQLTTFHYQVQGSGQTRPN